MARGELPKYRAIADDLRRRIDSRELTPGDRLPSQQALAGEYGVTVMTLRQALVELEREGRVRTAQGKGTFVAAAPTVSFGLDRLSSFAQEMAQQGTAVETDVMSVQPVVGDGPAELPADVALMTITRRRSIDGRRIVVQRSTLATDHWNAIADVDLAAVSLYDALADRAGLRVERATESFRAVSLGRADADALDVAEGSACLESTRVSYADDEPFLIDRALLLGSASEIRAERTADDLRLGYATPT